jgi:hypothetical protein
VLGPYAFPLDHTWVKSLFEGNIPLNKTYSTRNQTYIQNQANNQIQWSSNLFKLLDMKVIPSYPSQIPPKYEKWLPKFISNDVISVEDHMRNLWEFFLLHPISDDVEYLAMKLFLLPSMMAQDVGTMVFLMAILKPWISWKKFSSNDGVPKMTPICY